MSSAATAQAFWITRPGQGEILAQNIAAPQPGEMRIRTLYSAISRGTETLVYSGNVPKSEYMRMRAPFQEGEFSCPVKYGYINVGIVEDGPPQLTGRRVFTLYPHQTHFNISTDAALPLPQDVPPERAVLAANLETALNALWDCELERGARVSIVGAGALGCLCAWLARHEYDAEVELIDTQSARAAVAEQLGVAFALPEQACGGASVVVHTSATEQGLQTSLSLAEFEGLIVELSWYGDKQPRVPLGGAFHSQRLTIKSSQVGHIAPAMRGQLSLRDRLNSALQRLSDPQLDCLIDTESNFADLPLVLADLASGKRKSICHRICYE